MGIRWPACVVALAAGCGRINFDTGGTPDAAHVDDDVGLPVACPRGYTELATGCYRLAGDGSERTWLDAELACESDGPGAHLVVVDGATEAMALDAFASGAAADFFIGVTDLVTEETYRTVTDVPVGYSVWGENEPDGDPAQNCIELGALELSDVDCDAVNDYVCEYDGIRAVPSAYGAAAR